MSSLKEVVAHAMALHRQGDEDGAAAVFEKLLKAKPHETLALDYLGTRANKKGDYKTAITLLRQALVQPKCRVAVRLQLGHALRDSGQLIDAADTYRRYVTDSSDPIGASVLADVLFDLDRIHEAETVLRQAIDWKPGYVKALCQLARACDEEHKPTDAAEFRQQAVDSEETGKQIGLMKAAAHVDLGNIEEAFDALDDSVNGLFGEAFDDAIKALDLTTLPDLHGKLPSAMGVPLIVACGDPFYVRRYGPALAHSVAANSPGSDFHLHVVIPGLEGEPPPLPADMPGHSLTWEVERDANRVTFSTRRFVRAAALMRMMDRPLVLIDMDSIANKDIATANTGLPPFDVAMRYQKSEIFLNQRASAAFLTLTPTSAAQKYIDAVAAYIQHFERTGTALWSLDQMALLAARYKFLAPDSRDTVKIVDVPDRYVDWRRHGPDSVLWTTKGAGKALPK